MSRRLAALRMLIVVTVLVVFGMAPVHARIQPSDGNLVGIQTHNILDEFPIAGNEPPANLATSRDVYVIVTVGVRFGEVKVLARPTVPAYRLATALERSLAGTWLSGSAIEWSNEDYAAADVTAVGSKLSLHPSVTVPLGVIEADLRSAGYIPHFVVRIPRYGVSAPHLHASYTTLVRYWSAGRDLAGISAVTVSGTFSAPEILAVISLVLAPVLWALVCFGAALIRAKQPSGNNDTDRAKFQKMAMQTGAALVPVAILLPIFVARSLPAYAVADKLLGVSESVDLAMDLEVTALLLCVPYFLLANRYLTRRYGKPAFATAFVQSQSAARAAMSHEEKSLTKRQAVVQAIPHLIGLVAIFVGFQFLHRRTAWASIHFLSPIAGLLAAAIASIYAKRLRTITRKTIDDPLTWRAQQLAQHFGTRIQAVRIDDSGIGRTHVFYERSATEIILSDMLRSTLSPEEIDFVLAAAATGGSPSGRLWWMWLVLVVWAPTAFGAWKLIHHSGAMIWSMLLMIGPSFAAIPFMKRMRRTRNRRNAEIAVSNDAAAVEVTHDYTAAASALTKLVANPIHTAAASGDASDLASVLAQRHARMQELAASKTEAGTSIRSK